MVSWSKNSSVSRSEVLIRQKTANGAGGLSGNITAQAAINPKRCADILLVFMQNHAYAQTRLLSLLLLLLSAARSGAAQAVPNPGEKIESPVTFGSAGPDEQRRRRFYANVFFLVPDKERQPLYIRVLTPTAGGSLMRR
ncbi:MAG: hypothetical protein WKG07_03475 [Hymenobacter sp.]